VLCLAFPFRERVGGPERRGPALPDLRQLASWCEQFSPLVALDEATSSLLLDVTGVAAWFGGESALAERLLEQLEALGHRPAAALADTPGAARALARRREGGAVLIVPSGEAATLTALAELPVETLRLEPKHLAWLTALGIERIEQLAALPRAALAERFGQELLKRFDQVLGRAAETIVPHRPAPTLVVEQTFEFPTDSLELLAAAMSERLAVLVRPVAERRWGVERLEVRLNGAAGVLAQFTLGVYCATARVDYLLELIRLRLERLRLSEPVTGLRLAVSSEAPLGCRQQELFPAGSTRDDRHHLGELIDHLASRLGSDAVVRAKLRADYQPELAWQAQPALSSPAPSASRRVRERTKEATEQPVLRPLRLVRRPRPVEVLSLVPAGPPQVFRLGAKEHRIVRHWGPERIETGWWRGRGVRRDYYCVETQPGGWCWLFRELPGGRWFLHGWYD